MIFVLFYLLPTDILVFNCWWSGGFSVNTKSRSVMEPTHRTLQRIQSALSPAIKRLELGSDYSLPHIAEAENVWSVIHLFSDIHVCEIVWSCVRLLLRWPIHESSQSWNSYVSVFVTYSLTIVKVYNYLSGWPFQGPSFDSGTIWKRDL
jgi:hypothetical protein